MRRPRRLATVPVAWPTRADRRRAMRRRSPAGATAALACLALVARLVRRGEAAALAPPFADATIP